MYIYKNSNLYHYKCFVFQYVEKDTLSYKNRNTYRLHKVMHILVCVSMWCCLIFEFFNFINGFKKFAEKLSLFKAAVSTLHRIIWMLRYVALHNVGMYLFIKHPGKIQDELDILYNQKEEDEKKNITKKIKKYERKTENLMVLSVICLILLPLLQKLVPIFIERRLNIDQNWNKVVETIEICIIPYTRIMSMPFFFNFIFLAHIQCVKIKHFTKNLKITNDHEEQAKAIKDYVELHNSVKKTSKDFHTYVIFLLILLLFWGALGAYSMMEMLQHLPKLSHSPVFSVIVSEFVGNLLTFLLETLFLYTVPLVILGKVSNTQKEVLPKILKESCSSKNALDIVNRIEKLQSTDGTGYTILNNSLTELNSIWLSLLGPIFTVVAGIIINEHF